MGIVANEFCATIIAGIVAAIFTGSKLPGLAGAAQRKEMYREGAEGAVKDHQDN